MAGVKNLVPKVSVIMPVYNMERYLAECMESVRNQTFQDIEIICVDDGSTDKSSSMLDKYASEDSRVKVIHKANSGYGPSMNIGLDSCSGEYIGIVEPDDFIKTNMVEVLYQNAVAHNLDMISSNYIRFYGNAKERIFQRCKVTNDSSLYNIVVNPYEKRDIFNGNFINPAGLFKRSFLNQFGIRHNETPGASYQDIGFCFQTLAFSRRMMLLDEAFYCYRQDNPNSSILNKGKMHCVIEEYAYIYRRIKEQNAELESFSPQFLSEKLGSYIYTLQRIAPEYREEFLCFIGNEFKTFQKNGELDVSALSDNQKEILRQIMENPQKFYELFMSFRQEIHKQLEQFEKAVIYGAGLIGKRIYDEIEEEDRKKIKGFAVTTLAGNLESYHGVAVRQIDDYLGEKENIAIVIGIAKQNRNAVIDMLSRKQFKNVIVLESLGVNI